MNRIDTHLLSALAASLVFGALASGGCSVDAIVSTASTTAGQGGAGGAPGSGGTGGTSISPLDVDDDDDGTTENQGDCNDADATIHPGADEVCLNDVDDDCDLKIDESLDVDGDGFGACAGDCDETNVAINPAATELAGDGIDNDCDGFIDADFDGDGFTTANGDCDDTNTDVHPGATEDCADGIDNDCNTFIDAAEPDADNDGAGPCSGDCDEGDPTVGPFEPELPGDNIDNNCDFLIDFDIDADGWTAQNGDCEDQNPAINPSVVEVCGDSIDNNCNGDIDTDCLTPCQLADLYASSVGCLYYAIDANNDPAENFDTLPFAVAVSNTDPLTTANVQIQTKQGGVWTMIQQFAVAPGTLHQFNLPDRHINYTGLNTAGAYRVVSDLPIIAYQFQPIDGVSSFTSDASLLLPRSALDRFYYVAGWGEPSFGNAQIVIAAAEDDTVVTVTPTTGVQAGGPITAIAANTPRTFAAMDQGDYIQLEGPAASFTGTYISSDKPIVVFSSHWCANVPIQVCCCDHLEEQLMGLQTWGKTYVASRMPVRSTGTPDATYWHVVASQPATTVSFIANPAVTGLPVGPQTLGAGGFLTLGVTGTVANPGDFIVTADKPIFLMEYLTSGGMTNASTQLAGDPAMTQAVPVEQFLDRYLVLIPANWIYDFFVITKPIGSTVTVDGVAIPQSSFVPINDGVNPVAWEVARRATADGVHEVVGTAPFGVMVVGYDSYDSYAYPGGLNQKILNPMN